MLIQLNRLRDANKLDHKDDVYFFMARTTYVTLHTYSGTSMVDSAPAKGDAATPMYVDLALAGSLTSKANCRESRAAANSGDQLRKHSCTCRN